MAENKDKLNHKTHPKVTINEKWCKKCGICGAFCPRGVFVTDDFGKPIAKYSQNCIKCMLCVIRCPDFAIEVEEEEKKDPDSE